MDSEDNAKFPSEDDDGGGDDGEQNSSPSSTLSIVGVEDMIILDNLTEETLLANIRERYEKDLIYVLIYYLLYLLLLSISICIISIIFLYLYI